LKTDEGACLVVTDDGQRWLVTPKDPARPCEGSGIASGSPSLDPLVSAQRVGDEYRFIGEGGVVYTAREPLGPFVKFARAPSYLRRVSAHGSTIIGVDEAGTTFYFDDGWKRANVPAGLGAIDVGTNADGHSLLLAAPEALLVSTDHGRTFTRPSTPAPRIGAYEVGQTVSGALAARGALGAIVLSKSGSFAKSSELLQDVAAAEAVIEPRTGPRAASLREGRADLAGQRYYEIQEAFEGSRWMLLRGVLGGELVGTPLQGQEACDNLKVAARADKVVLGCLRESEDRLDLTVELFLSNDSGDTFASIAKLAAGGGRVQDR
jgi:hypothetical protein